MLLSRRAARRDAAAARRKKRSVARSTAGPKSASQSAIPPSASAGM